MPEPTDDDLMRTFHAGDAAAFEALQARHQAALYLFVRRLLGSSAATQADGVFQDTWLHATPARHTWQPQGAAWRTWLFTLTHHRAVDCLRKTGGAKSASTATMATCPGRTRLRRADVGGCSRGALSGALALAASTLHLQWQRGGATVARFGFARDSVGWYGPSAAREHAVLRPAVLRDLLDQLVR